MRHEADIGCRNQDTINGIWEPRQRLSRGLIGRRWGGFMVELALYELTSSRLPYLQDADRRPVEPG